MLLTAIDPCALPQNSGTESTLNISSRRRVKRSSILVVVCIIVMLLLAVGAKLFFPAQNDAIPYSPQSTNPDGAAALAAILEDHGVNVHHVTSTADLADVPENATLFVTNPSSVKYPGSDIAELGLPTIVVEGSSRIWTTDWGFEGMFRNATGAEHEQSVDLSPFLNFCGSLAIGDNGSETASISPANTASDASKQKLAARSTTAHDVVHHIDPTDTFYYGITSLSTHEPEVPEPTIPKSQAQESRGKQGEHTPAMADGLVLARSEQYPNIWFYGAPHSLTNEHLESAGNAAAIITLLGQYRDLYWITDLKTANAPSSDSIGGPLPNWMKAAMLSLVLSGLWLALVKGRRLGPLVPEPMPSSAHGEEANEGRAHLYYEHHAYQHAASILRAHALHRNAKLLGITHPFNEADTTRRIAHLTGRSPTEIYNIFFAPHITSDDALIKVHQNISLVEQEIHDGTQR